MTRPGVGDVLDERYLLRREVARGAMGVLHEARHAVTGRRVALKRMTTTVRGDDTELRVRLLREARALGAVLHPGIVEILDAGIASGEPYLVLEMLDGRTLEGLLIARGFLPAEEAVSITLEICDALSAAHHAGVVHRDIKPSNVFLANDVRGNRTVKVIDFGIAALEESPEPRAAAMTMSNKLTSPGQLLGTPEYMAPEQLMGRQVDLRCDVYAVGVTLFEMLTGCVPFSGSYPEVLVKVETTPVPPSVRQVRPEISEQLANVITGSLAHEAAHRYPTMYAFACALRAAMGNVGRTPLAPPSASVAPSSREPFAPPVMLTSVAAPQMATAIAAYRRRFARAPYTTPVVVRRGDDFVAGHTEDISEGGLLIIVEEPRFDREEVLVDLALPNGGTIVCLRGIAKWVRAGRMGKAALGIELVDAPEAVRDAIRTFVEANAAAT